MYRTDEKQGRIAGLLIWRRWGASLVLDTVLVFALLYFFDDDYSPGVEPIDIALGVAALWVAQSLLAAKNWIWTMLTNVVVGSKLIRAEFLGILRASRLVWPDCWAARFESLAQIADDETEKVDTRLKAASIFYLWTGAMKARGFTAEIMLEQAWDEAIKEYVAEQPRAAR